MANAIKQVSVQKGHDVTRFALQCFGGAAGQHACLVADALGMETVFIHPYAGVLSAYGMGLADQSAMREQAVEKPLNAELMPELDALADQLAPRPRGGCWSRARTRADRAYQHRASALRRHRGRVAGAVARSSRRGARFHRRASREVRLRHAGAAADRRDRSRSKPPRAAIGCRETTLAAGDRRTRTDRSRIAVHAWPRP